MAKANEYTAVATAKMRLAEIMTDNGIDADTSVHVVNLIEHTGASVELKPRLKAVQITIPIPQPKPEPKLGEFSPKPVPEDGYNDEEAPVE